MYEVHIYIWHSPEYASALLSSSYTSQVNDILQRIPSFDDYHVDCRHFVLRQKLEGSTPLSFLRLIIAEEAGIPRSLQSYFRPEPIERGRPWGDTLSDAVDLNDLQAFSQNRRGRIHLYMSTTAQTLKDIVSLHPGSGDGIVGQILAWRHYVSALKYLKKANEKSIIQKNKNNHNKVLRKNEKMERKSAEAVRTMFHHWDRLVRGVEQLRTVPDPGETMEAREQDVETRYRQFILEKKETLARLWAKTSMVSVDGTSLPNQQASSEHSRNSPIVLKTSGKKGAVESGLEFDFPEATEKITINPLRTESGHLLPNSSSFKLRSGVLLWGQLHTVFAGSISKTFQGNANSVPQQLPGGTIEQYELNYRSAARNGEWKVRKAYHIPPPWTAEEPTAQFGWIIYHEAVDPLRALDRCSRISPSEQGKSRGNAHVDKVIPLLDPSQFQPQTVSYFAQANKSPAPCRVNYKSTKRKSRSCIETDEVTGCVLHRPL